MFRHCQVQVQTCMDSNRRLHANNFIQFSTTDFSSALLFQLMLLCMTFMQHTAEPDLFAKMWS